MVLTMWNYLLEPDIFRSFHWWRRDEENRAQKSINWFLRSILFYLNECRQCAFNSIYIKLMGDSIGISLAVYKSMMLTWIHMCALYWLMHDNEIHFVFLRWNLSWKPCNKLWIYSMNWLIELFITTNRKLIKN